MRLMLLVFEEQANDRSTLPIILHHQNVSSSSSSAALTSNNITLITNVTSRQM